MGDRIEKLLNALLAILGIVTAVANDIVQAGKEAWQAIKTGNVQVALNAVMRLLGIVESVWSQLGKAITDLLDALRTSNTGNK